MELEIKAYLEENIPKLKDRIFPVFTEELSDISVVYKFTPLSGGHLKESQLELRIIHSDYDVCKEMEEKVRSVFDQEEDAPFITYAGVRFRSELAGGGVLFNDGCQMWEDTLYFIFDWRTIHGKQ